MIIGLMGFECVSPNKGCEALGYSFVSILREICNDDFALYVFSNDELGRFVKYYDDLTIIQNPLRIKDISAKTIRAMAKCDFIFDITLGDSFSDIYSKEQCLGNLRFKYLAEMFCKKYVLLPQTYGPFSDEGVKKKASRVISKAFKVYSRDKKSKAYIQHLLPSADVFETTDLAFVLPYDKSLFTIDHKKLNIGINVSGLLWKGGFTGKNQFKMSFDYKKFIDKSIQILLEDDGIEIHLIPHVIDLKNDSYDDDYKCQKELAEKYNILMAPAFENPIQAKSYISEMDCFIGSRMHSTIAAISSGVPTLPVSYSRKFEGLFETLEYPYIIHGNDSTIEEAIVSIYGIKNSLKDMKEKVIHSKNISDRMIDDFRNDLKTLISDGEIL